MHFALLSNDVVPGMGVPVAAPGLRAWGMAEGLRELGHQVTVLVDQRILPQAWKPEIAPPQPPGVLVTGPRTMSNFARRRKVDAVVITNSNLSPLLGDIGEAKLIYDFFAPKMLELTEEEEQMEARGVKPEGWESALPNLRERKLAALRKSDGVIINGAKKLDYVSDWMAEAGIGDRPRAVVNMALPPRVPNPPTSGPLQVVVSGYLQPWSRPGAWVDAIRPLMDAGLAQLHLMVGAHWGPKVASDLPPDLAALTQHPGVVRHGLLRLRDFRNLMARSHLSIDVFEPNPERELAMVTRSVVALSSGLPVMHVPFTEVSPLIEQHGAGWLVDYADAGAIERILRDMADDLSRVTPYREGASEAARTVFNPAIAVRPLVTLVEELHEDTAEHASSRAAAEDRGDQLADIFDDESLAHDDLAVEKPR